MLLCFSKPCTANDTSPVTVLVTGTSHWQPENWKALRKRSAVTRFRRPAVGGKVPRHIDNITLHVQLLALKIWSPGQISHHDSFADSFGSWFQKVQVRLGVSVSGGLMTLPSHARASCDGLQRLCTSHEPEPKWGPTGQLHQILPVALKFLHVRVRPDSLLCSAPREALPLLW
jgi:hypothetical protein